MGAISRDLSSAAMVEAIEVSWVGANENFGRTPRTELYDEGPGLRWLLTPSVPHPIFNHVYLARLAKEEDVDARIERALESFVGRGVPFMWSVGPFTQPADLGERLVSLGLSLSEELPGMAVELQATNEDLPYPSAPAVERVEEEEALRECIEVMRVGFELPEITSEILFEAFTAAGLTEESPLRSYVGRLGGKAVAASSLFVAAGVAGIYNVATLPGARGQGLGTALTLEAMRGAREMGYPIAVLQSSEMGFGVYSRLGFKQYSTYSVYVGTGQG